MDGHDAVVHFAAESHVDRSIVVARRVRAHELRRHQRDVRRRPPASASSGSCTSPPTRSTARSRRARSPRPTRSSPRSPYSASKAGSDLIALSYHDHLRAPGARHPVVEQLRAVPVPREGDPALRHQPARGQEGAALRRRPQRARLVLRRATTAPASTSCCAPAPSARSTTSAAATRSPNRELTDTILADPRRTTSR